MMNRFSRTFKTFLLHGIGDFKFSLRSFGSLYSRPALIKLRKLLRHFNLLILLFVGVLAGCSVSTFGKLQADKGVPEFIQVGMTERDEVFNKLGEPLVHRVVAGRETAIYSHEKGEYWFLYGTYEGRELVLQFDADARIEEAGSDWGVV